MRKKQAEPCLLFGIMLSLGLKITWTTWPPLCAISRSLLWHLCAWSNRTNCCWISFRFSGSAELAAACGPPPAPGGNWELLIPDITLTWPTFCNDWFGWLTWTTGTPKWRNLENHCVDQISSLQSKKVKSSLLALTNCTSIWVGQTCDNWNR